jgi:hypothetical protein
MNDWMYKWMNKCMIDWMNESMNERMSVGMNEWRNVQSSAENEVLPKTRKMSLWHCAAFFFGTHV